VKTTNFIESCIQERHVHPHSDSVQHEPFLWFQGVIANNLGMSLS
jgi:hypothetical protein